MNVLNTQYTGTCPLLATDYMAMANMYSFKQEHPYSWQSHLTKVPTRVSTLKKRGHASPSKLSPAKRA